MLEWIRDLLRLNVDLISRGGYPGVFLLMAVESSFLPLPSEVVVPPAGYLAWKGEMSLPWIVIAAALGSLAGASFNYWFAIRVGRPFFHRHGRWFLVTEKGLDRAESFIARHGEIGTFIGRLVPGVRHLVSLPAGLARMHRGRFALFTTLGSAIWCSVLAWVGWSIGRAGDRLDLGMVKDLTTRIFLYGVLPGVALLVAAYVLVRRRQARRAP